MLYLILSVVCSVLIANLLMVFNRKGRRSILPVFLGNYLVAGIFSFGSIPRPMSMPPAFDIVLGILTGGFFLVNFWVYQRSMVVNGLSLSVGIMRIAMIIPVLMAVILFRDRLNAWNVLGIVLGLAAFGMRANLSELHNLLWIVGLFLISGITDASLKIYKELGSGMEPVFIFIIFGSAFIYTLAAIIAGKQRLGLKSLLFGCALGIPNRYSTVFFLKGLDTVPASIAYPLVAVSIMLLSIVCDLLIWKKQAKRGDVLLWALLLASLLLLNL